jgi:hypothetical protein
MTSPVAIVIRDPNMDTIRLFDNLEERHALIRFSEEWAANDEAGCDCVEVELAL